MFSSVLSRLTTAMAEGTKAVSKRSARTYIDDIEENTSDHQLTRVARNDEAVLDERGRKNSTSTSTSSQSCQSSRQTSIEAPTVAAVAEWEHETVKASPIEGRSYSDGTASSGLLDPSGSLPMFGPYAMNSNINLEESLPASGRPINFGVVVPGVYRSSFPKTEDHEFISGLKLKTIVTLVQKDFPEGYDAFVRKNGINHHVFDMRGTKKERIPDKTMKSILQLVLNQKNHPLLIHCNHGKHRTGCVVAVVRILTGWDLGHVITEYKTYAEPKVRECDIEYITGFRPSSISNLFAKDTNAQLRFRRAVLFALFVLLLWVVSSKRITVPPERRLSLV